MHPAQSEGLTYRTIWRRFRIAVLLLVLVAVVFKYRDKVLAESWVSDWSAPEVVSVVLLVPPGADEDELELVADVQRYAEAGEGDATYVALEHWFEQEFARFHRGRAGFAPISLRVREPWQTAALPPNPPRASTGVVEQTQGMQAFLAYFQALEAQRAIPEQNAVFVVFYPEEDRERFTRVHSVADRASRRGFVFAPLTEAGRDLAVTDTAHELLHLFGATDKYEGSACVFPEGYYEPFLEPRHPQRFAEVMALGIPQATGAREVTTFGFDEVRIGTATAREIGWIDDVRAERYYGQQDPAAGPRTDAD